MRKVLVLVLGLFTLGAAGFAQDRPAALDAKQARVYAAARGGSLTRPSMAAPAAVVAQFLRESGVSASTVASLRVVAQYRSPVTGLVHVRMEQEVAGLRVADAYIKAAVNQRGELVHLIQNIALLKGTGVAAARVNERQALRAALAKLHPALQQDPAIAGRQGNVTTFVKSAFFHTAPTVERVAVLMESKALKAGFLVETWSERGNLLHETLVDGGGRVVGVERRTNTDSYNIFPDHPGNSTQTVTAGPGAGNAESPAGWLTGSQTSVNISGNNAHAYLDTDANNAPDAGGTAVTDGNFLTAADLTMAPGMSDNQNVAVQNLFYLNNVIHDELYSRGFVEGVGNFQENNFGNGGRGSDSVNAEAQDGSGTDNANFATPGDGRNPRMQMFLWTGKGDHQVIVNAVTYRAQGAVFGGTLDATGITDDIVLVNDGTGTTSDACETITNAGDVSGKIALIDRGTCTFVIKVKNAQNAGAVGAIVANNAGDSIFTMGGTDATITIPPVFIGQSDGTTIKALLPIGGTIRLTDPAPLMRDGDVDSDIVWHEYGHGLTWRMIGRMSGSLSGAIGEGMSDVLAVLRNENDVVGEYSFDDALGIRTAAYTNYPRTYGDVAGTEVHFDGEVYGAIGWRLFENFGAGSKDTLLGYMVDGMNFTPAAPSFEDMRDGILASVANAGNPSGHACLVWDAFADYGVGVGASGQARGPNVVVTESFAVPSECSGP